jgi:hypothetical protein
MESSERLDSAGDPTLSQITYAVIEALLYLYEQTTLPSLDDMRDQVDQAIGGNQEVCDRIIARLIDKQFPYLLVEGDAVSFGVNGLWFLENSFMHGEEIDSMALAERILTQNKFFT